MKNLLVIANPFPPLVSAGNQRVLRFLRHLPEQGWEPTVLTVEARGEAPVPDGLPVPRAPVPVPRRLLQGGPRSAKINRWLFIPDPYFGWVGPAVVKGRVCSRVSGSTPSSRARRGRRSTSLRPSSAGGAVCPGSPTTATRG